MVSIEKGEKNTKKKRQRRWISGQSQGLWILQHLLLFPVFFKTSFRRNLFLCIIFIGVSYSRDTRPKKLRMSPKEIHRWTKGNKRLLPFGILFIPTMRALFLAGLLHEMNISPTSHPNTISSIFHTTIFSQNKTRFHMKEKELLKAQVVKLAVQHF